jgi:signal transduction histidine kinase
MSASDTAIRAAILRAKDEWECTVDALPDLICLLDVAGKVVRVNRVVERWQLHPVAEALGLELHELLHPHCAESGCALAAALAGAWGSLRLNSDPQEFELRDPRLERALHVTMRPMPPDADAKVEALSVAVVADVTALHLAREAISTINQELETRVRSRTADVAEANRDLQNEIARREGAEQAVRRSRNELATLSHQLMIAQEAERKRIARELHDSIGQQLSAIKYALERVETCIEGREEVRPQIESAIGALQGTMDDLRTIAMNLRPPVLDDLGAVSAVSWFCRQFGQNYPELQLREKVSVGDADVPERLSTAVFRSLQEMLNNVAKHAQAREVVVTLSRAPGQLILEVEDDGVGIQNRPLDAGMRTGRGLRNLRERAAMTGGEFTVVNRPAGSGTRARIEWQLVPATAAHDKSNAA